MRHFTHYQREYEGRKYRQSLKDCWVEYSVFATMFTIPLAALSVLV